MDFSLIAILSLMASGLLLSLYLIAADEKRFMAQFSLHDWQPRKYQSLLSNFLQAIHDGGIRTPWPRRLNAFSAAFFRVRIRRAIKGRPTFQRAGFLKSHLNLAALMYMLKPFIDDEILARQTLVVTGRIVTMADTSDRDRLTSFTERAAEIRAAFHARLTALDRQIQTHLRDTQFMPMLAQMHAIFQEHGYCLLPQLDDLRLWESMDGTELAQILPPLTLPKATQNWPCLVHSD